MLLPTPSLCGTHAYSHAIPRLQDAAQGHGWSRIDPVPHLPSSLFPFLWQLLPALLLLLLLLAKSAPCPGRMIDTRQIPSATARIVVSA